VGAFEDASAFGLALEGAFGDPVKIAAGEMPIAPAELVEQLGLLLPKAEPQSNLFPKISIDARRRLRADRLVVDARLRASQQRFFHWEISFPNVWSGLLSSEPKGGFDAVIGNPPYIRQELLGDEVKRALKADYSVFDGMADLYVYFFEQGLRLLRPGGRLSYVVTNKWLKAGYAEALRDLFTSKGQVEFVADFGHAKHFFPDADVFPSVVVVRKPVPGQTALPDSQICVIPRDAVPEKGLSAAVAAATYPLPRAHFTKESWTLEPPDVMSLLDKIRRNGVPLAEYAGVEPLYGIKTGLNDAFLVDAVTRDRLVKEDPGCADVIKPYLRGQDIERWWSPPSGLYMILLKSSGDHPWPWADAPDEAEAERRFKAAYPSLHGHMKAWESLTDPETGKKRGLRHREDQGRYWWELRPCAYYEKFERPKQMVRRIAFYAQISIDAGGLIVNDSAIIAPSPKPQIAVALNSATGWYYTFKRYPHKKDEAIAMDIAYFEDHPIADVSDEVLPHVEAITECSQNLRSSVTTLHDWLRHEFGLEKPGRTLAEPHQFDGDGFVAAVRAALPKSRKWSAAEIARLKQEFAETLAPARNAAAEILALERKLSDLVNAAYGLTFDEVALMWRTAPPRMPLNPNEELRRAGIETVGP
jgi:hypothetical protein